MAHALHPIPKKTRLILTLAIGAALLALLLVAWVLDERTEAAEPVDLAFTRLIALCLGPVMLFSGFAWLALMGRPHHGKLVPLALGFIAFGGLITWLFFFETAELPALFSR